MSAKATLVSDFDAECASTRRVLERLPDAKLTFKAHPRSWPAGDLAAHLANIPTWMVLTIQREAFDIAPPGAPPFKAPSFDATAAVLHAFDANAAGARAALAATTDEHLERPWALQRGGVTLFSMPRKDALRRFVVHHLIHHRAQLGVLLRLMEVPVPSTYGPTADEAMA